VFLYGCKRFFALVLSCLIALCVFAVARVSAFCKFSAYEGTRTFYLYSASSQGAQTQTLSFWDMNAVRGESVRFACEKGLAQTLATDIMERYGATLRFTERADGTQSVYAYTEKWQDSVMINGVKVNLHIAFSETEFAIGSPIIFGGF